MTVCPKHRDVYGIRWRTCEDQLLRPNISCEPYKGPNTRCSILRAILRVMAELHRVSTPKFVARNIARNVAAVESLPTSATLRATNFFVYPPSAAFRAIV